MLVKDILFEAPKYAKKHGMEYVPHGAHRFYDNKRDIEVWLSSRQITKYTINDDLTVDVDGDVVCGQGIAFIPIQFGTVTGNFWCDTNDRLETLKGCPHTVGKKFTCAYNPALRSLEFGPKKVGGLYNARQCNLDSLVGAAEEVGGNFNAFQNNLLNIKGAPRKVGGDFAVYYNKIRSLEGSPDEVGGTYNCSNNKLSSLEGITPVIGKAVNCDYNPIKSFVGISKMIKQMGGQFGAYGCSAVEEGGLGLWRIKGCSKVVFGSGMGSKVHAPSEKLEKVFEIINKYYNAPFNNDTVIKIQTDLLQAGLREYAKL